MALIALDETQVHVQGEQLADIWWRGKQWAVTEYGIEALDGTYYVEKDRLLEEAENWPWPRQLGTKRWVDPDEFCTAFMVAIVLHGFSEINSESLRMHLTKMMEGRIKEGWPKHGAADPR
uniref:hypothetical protein n=1 Tax=Stappia sp. TaxID=1870903 RepID=UPI003BA88F44